MCIYIYTSAHIDIPQLWERLFIKILLMSRCQVFESCILLFILLSITLCSLHTVCFPFPWHLGSSSSNCLNNSELLVLFAQTLGTLTSLGHHFWLDFYGVWHTGSAPREKREHLTHFYAFPFSPGSWPIKSGCPGCFWCLQTSNLDFLNSVL